MWWYAIEQSISNLFDFSNGKTIITNFATQLPIQKKQTRGNKQERLRLDDIQLRLLQALTKRRKKENRNLETTPYEFDEI